jgi:hypothetical protein
VQTTTAVQTTSPAHPDSTYALASVHLRQPVCTCASQCAPPPLVAYTGCTRYPSGGAQRGAQHATASPFLQRFHLQRGTQHISKPVSILQQYRYYSSIVSISSGAPSILAAAHK